MAGDDREHEMNTAFRKKPLEIKKVADTFRVLCYKEQKLRYEKQELLRDWKTSFAAALLFIPKHMIT